MSIDTNLDSWNRNPQRVQPRQLLCLGDLVHLLLRISVVVGVVCRALGGRTRNGGDVGAELSLEEHAETGETVAWGDRGVRVVFLGEFGGLVVVVVVVLL